ncbi:MAG: hypothetical protein J6N52_00495 [Clostridia bacterium]|nr:hypothetical protein [Clostridia bacterium]
MKELLKKFTAALTAAILCFSLMTSAFAIIDTSGMEPAVDVDFSNEEWKQYLTINEGADAIAAQNGKLEMRYNWELNTREMYADAVLEFDVCFDQATNLTITTNQDGRTYNYYYINLEEESLRVHRIVDKNGGNVIPDGIIDSGGEVEKMVPGITYRMRIETVRDTVSVYIKKADESEYLYEGKFQSSGLVQTSGYTKIRFNEPPGGALAATLDNIQIYDLNSKMSIAENSVSAKINSSFKISFSEAPSEILTAQDFELYNADGTLIDAIGSVTGSGKDYTVTLKSWLEYETQYTLKLKEGFITEQGYAINTKADFVTAALPKYELDIDDVIVDYSDGTVNVEAELSRNIRQAVNAAAVCGVYKITDNIEECIGVRVGTAENVDQDIFSLTFGAINTEETELAVRIYAFDSLDSMHSKAYVVQK